ncbi:hypothetical protein [Priestia megaterium]|uniref:hypothetical protein n=1 Tax=Priestia megaterium TaxID=1404 RepID=UPI00234EDAC3|nr:hypothetical protein [Priestia megaterium]MDC7781855.1 hypothetical protein [Priestia megaterium]
MEINIGTKTVEESNEFLRCLWAEMGKEFGQCGWNYNPGKNGAEQRVFFGNMHINQDFPIAVSISYKNKGSINNIYFLSTIKSYEIEKGTELYGRFKKVIKATRKNIGKHEEYLIESPIKSNHPLMPYKGNNFEIKLISQEGGFKVRLKIKAYDKKQASHYINKLFGELMDFLSVETDDIFWSDHKDIDYDKLEFEETFLERELMDPNFLIWGHRAISKGGKQFIDILTDSNRKDDPNLNLFLKACNHFHTARMQEEQISKGYENEDIKKIGTSQTEVATTLYLSALEVVSLIDFKEENCKCCGQPKYEISSRIINMVSNYISDSFGDLFKKFYEQRSDYLHQGVKLITKTPWEFINPQLDVNADNLCEYPHNIQLSYLRECVGYCLRSFYKDKFLE